MSSPLLAALSDLVEASADADDALRATVVLLTSQPGVAWAGIAFLDGGDLKVGPQAGTPDASHRTALPIVYEGEPIGELWLDGACDAELLADVAALISTHVLVGWDTGGEAWDP